MNSQFANGKVDSVELIIKSFPVSWSISFFILDFSILGISEWLLVTSSSGTSRYKEVRNVHSYTIFII